jgi:hypothetical protein
MHECMPSMSVHGMKRRELRERLQKKRKVGGERCEDRRATILRVYILSSRFDMLQKGKSSSVNAVGIQSELGDSWGQRVKRVTGVG